MDAGTAAGWLREVLEALIPSWAGRDAVLALPDGVLLLGAPLLLVVIVGLGLNSVVRIVEAYHKTATLVAPRPPLPDPATREGQEEIHRQLEAARAESAAMRAQLDAILAAVSPPAGAPPLTPEARAAKEGAVLALIADPAPPAREAARDLARGDLAEAFAALERDARALEQAAAGKWRRLGDLAQGVDTARARAAYEHAFRLELGDFWTCVTLARLRRAAGDLRAAGEAALAAENAAGGAARCCRKPVEAGGAARLRSGLGGGGGAARGDAGARHPGAGGRAVPRRGPRPRRPLSRPSQPLPPREGVGERGASVRGHPVRRPLRRRPLARSSLPPCSARSRTLRAGCAGGRVPRCTATSPGRRPARAHP